MSFIVGPPTQIEQYVQETGRVPHGNPRKHTQHKMLEYCNNFVACRHTTLFKHFSDINILKYKCCDICALHCNCNERVANHA